MIETHTTVIKGRQYVVTELGASESRKVLALLAPYIAALSSGGDDEAAAIKALLQRISLEDLDKLTAIFAAKTKVAGDLVADKVTPLTPELEMWFAGKRWTDWMQWLFFCLKENFGGFSEELGGLLGSLSGQTGQPSESRNPSPSDGTSGGSSQVSGSP